MGGWVLYTEWVICQASLGVEVAAVRNWWRVVGIVGVMGLSAVAGAAVKPGVTVAADGSGQYSTVKATVQKPVETVAADGNGQYKTVQAAVDAVGEGGAVISIAPGVYREKLRIAANGVELKGMGKAPGEVVLVWDDSAKSAGGTGKSGSVSVSGDDFRAENLTIQNDFEKKNGRIGEGSQAVALLLTGDREVLRHVRLLGYQDTLYAASKTCHGEADQKAAEASGTACHASRQLFEDCYIEGHVDYIFGDAKAVFKNCELHGMTHTIVTITAQSRLYPLEDSGYLFLDCTITGDAAVDKHSYGRPWRAYATVYFVNTTLKGVVLDPPGWMEWAGKLATSTYGEYNTRDADGTVADVSKRIMPSKQLTKAEAEKLTVKGWLAGWAVE
jgi:pectinesterase